MIVSALNGGASTAADLIALNAGAALYVAGCVESVKEGVVMAQKSISSGAARTKIDQLASFTNSI